MSIYILHLIRPVERYKLKLKTFTNCLIHTVKLNKLIILTAVCLSITLMLHCIQTKRNFQYELDNWLNIVVLLLLLTSKITSNVNQLSPDGNVIMLNFMNTNGITTVRGCLVNNKALIFNTYMQSGSPLFFVLYVTDVLCSPRFHLHLHE